MVTVMAVVTDTVAGMAIVAGMDTVAVMATADIVATVIAHIAVTAMVDTVATGDITDMVMADATKTLVKALGGLSGPPFNGVLKSKIRHDAFLLPVAITGRFRAFAISEFLRQRLLVFRLPSCLSLCQRTCRRIAPTLFNVGVFGFGHGLLPWSGDGNASHIQTVKVCLRAPSDSNDVFLSDRSIASS